eukprot:5416054-Amphidinium_carterae.1
MLVLLAFLVIRLLFELWNFGGRAWWYSFWFRSVTGLGATPGVEMCGDFKRGLCTRADRCKYSHGDVAVLASSAAAPGARMKPPHGSVTFIQVSRPLVLTIRPSASVMQLTTSHGLCFYLNNVQFILPQPLRSRRQGRNSQ